MLKARYAPVLIFTLWSIPAFAADPPKSVGLNPPAPSVPGPDVVKTIAPEDWSGPLGIAARKPVFAGACKLCPWGQLAIVVKEALSYYNFDVHICWSCATSIGPHAMGDKTTAQQQFAANFWDADPAADPNAFRAFVDKTPPTVPDISATNESALVDAWNGTGVYAADNKKRQNYRAIALVHSPTYVLVAVNRKSGITDLSQVKTRKETRVVAAATDPVLAYYGITAASLQANGGALVSTNADRIVRAAADVWIGNAVMANTFEQRMWYEISQLSDVVYLSMEEPLIQKLTQSGYARSTVPFGFLRGVDRPIPTVSRVGGTLIYVRDDAPDDFAYTAAKALYEHRDLFRYQVSPWYYDTVLVTQSRIPLHPGARKFYRERGFLQSRARQ